MLFGRLLEAFWMPFGSRDVFRTLISFRTRKLPKSNFLGAPFWHNFDTFASMEAVSFLFFFWVRRFLTFCRFRVNLGSNFGGFLGYLGTLEIGLKRWREYDFHTLEALFAGMIFRLDSMSDFFRFLRFLTFFDFSLMPFGHFLDAFWIPGRPWSSFLQICEFKWFLERHRREK